MKTLSIALGLLACSPVIAYSQGALGDVSASASSSSGEQQRQIDQQYSLFGTLQANAAVTATTYRYFNGQPIPVSDTANAGIHADLTSGSLILDASGKSGGITGFADLSATASANLEFDVASQSLWTLALTDHTTQYGEYTIQIFDFAGNSLFWSSKIWSDGPHDQRASLSLNPGRFRLLLDFNAVNLTDTGSDAGSLALTMTTPVPLPASAWLLGAAAALQWALRRFGAGGGDLFTWRPQNTRVKNVKLDFCAQGDEVTDDTVAIQNAVNSQQSMYPPRAYTSWGKLPIDLPQLQH
jgi:hypothetical protein